MEQEVTVTVDYGSRIIQFIVDGVVCDGKGLPFGWGRFDNEIEDISTGWLQIDKTRKTITGGTGVIDTQNVRVAKQLASRA